MTKRGSHGKTKIHTDIRTKTAIIIRVHLCPTVLKKYVYRGAFTNYYQQCHAPRAV